MLKANCYRCHGEDGASEGGFNFVLEPGKAGHARVVKPRNAGRLAAVRAAFRPSDDSVMPPEGENAASLGRPTSPSIKAWIEAGAPAIADREAARRSSPTTQIVKYILADVRKASRALAAVPALLHADAPVQRRRLGRRAADLSQRLRQADQQPVVEHDAGHAARRSIRPGRCFASTSASSTGAARCGSRSRTANPYFLALNTPDALACYEATQCEHAVRPRRLVRVRRQQAAAVSQRAGPARDRRASWRSMLQRQRRRPTSTRSRRSGPAFNGSGVSQNNRLIERHKSPYGSYWKSYDFGGNTGRQNLFEHPLGPGGGSDSFQHDGGEIIFTLPNGLQGYLLVDAAGKRIDKGPTSIVSDPKRPDRAVTNGVSCMSCHYTGVIPRPTKWAPRCGPIPRRSRTRPISWPCIASRKT